MSFYLQQLESSSCWKLRHSFSAFRDIPQKIDVLRAARLNYGTHHRSGWNQAIWQMQLLHRESGILVDAFIERTLIWGDQPGEGNNEAKPHNRPWIGFIHCPCDVPEWYFPEMRPQHFLKTNLWQESEKHCLGLYCLSQKEKSRLQTLTDVPIDVLRLPTETPRITFSPEEYLQNPKKTILHIGYWLRQMHSIYFLKVPGWQKAILPGIVSLADQAFELERKQFQFQVDEASILKLSHLPANQYDELLSRNLVFLDLYDSSANNVVVECIVRNTPLLVNRIPPVVEYLGTDYPYYYQDLADASDKAANIELACEAHEYLKNCAIKKDISIKGFLTGFANSRIYQSLPLKP